MCLSTWVAQAHQTLPVPCRPPREVETAALEDKMPLKSAKETVPPSKQARHDVHGAVCDCLERLHFDLPVNELHTCQTKGVFSGRLNPTNTGLSLKLPGHLNADECFII
jgi:hypothetical protein